MRAINLIIAVLLTLQQTTTDGAEPIKALLYGRSEEVESRLGKLPKTISYQKVQRYLVGISGGIEISDVPAVLDAIRLHEWVSSFESPWRLFVHGDGAYARVTVKDNDTCFPPTKWFVVKDQGQWKAFDGPGTPTYFPQTPCIPDDVPVESDANGFCEISNPRDAVPETLGRLHRGMRKGAVDALLEGPDYSPTDGTYYYSTGGDCDLVDAKRKAPCGYVLEFQGEALSSCSWGAIAE